MIDFLYYALLFWLGYEIGVIRTVIKVRKIFVKIYSDDKIPVTKKLLNDLKNEKYEIEQIDSMLYLFNRDKNEFICQGETMEKIAELAFKYKNINMAEVQFKENIFSFREGKIVK